MARDGARDRRLAGLVRRAQAGDRAAFDELYARTAQVQWFSLVGKVGREAAPDVLQELYLIAWKNIASVKPEAFVGYLNGIARNLCLQHFNGAGTSKRPDPTEDEALEVELAERGPVVPADMVDPAKVADDRDEQARLARALREELSDDERNAVLLRYYEGMKLADVAEALDVSLATVKRLINQALATLRRTMGVLPVGAAFSAALARAAEADPAPGARLRAAADAAARERRGDWAAKAVGVAAVAAVVVVVGVAVTLPRPEVVPEEPVPAAVPAEAVAVPADTEGPELRDVSTLDGATVVTLADESGVARVWCENAEGDIFEPGSLEEGEGDASGSAEEAVGAGDAGGSDATAAVEGGASVSEWVFQLPTGEYTLHAADSLGNESTGPLSTDITPDAF